MTTTPDLGIPELSGSQANAEITHNEAIVLLQSLLNGVIDKDLSTPPGSPSDGDAYIVASGGTGAWSGWDDHIAVYYNGAWEFVPGYDDSGTAITMGARQQGLKVYVRDEEKLYIWTGSPLAWTEFASGGGGGLSDGDYGDITVGGGGTTMTIDAGAVDSTKLDETDSYTVGGITSTGDIDADGNDFILDADGDSYFHSPADDEAQLVLGAVDVVHSTTSELVINEGGVDLDVRIEGDGNTHLLTTDAGNDRVGIRTTSPQSALTVFGDGTSNYRGLTFTNSDTDGTSRGAMSIAGTRKTNANLPFAAFGNFDDGSARRLYIGGGSWSMPDATSIRIFTATTYNETNNAGVLRVEIFPDGGSVFGSATGGSKGAGTINCVAAYDDNNILSCYPFEQALDGKVTLSKWDSKVPDRVIKEVRSPDGKKILQPKQIIKRQHDPARKFKERIGTEYDPLTLDGYAKHWKEKRHLTSMPNEENYDPVNSPLSTGEWIQRLLEDAEIKAVHIDAMHTMIKEQKAEIDFLKQSINKKAVNKR